MAYDSKTWAKTSDCGGPYPDKAMRQGNSARPQNYTVNYAANIPGRLSRPQDDGAEHPNIAPKQAFRKELPAPSGPNYATQEYEPSDATPTTQAEIYKAHR